jgi:hypothetical protein
MGHQAARNFAAALEDAGRRFRLLVRDRDTKLTMWSWTVAARTPVSRSTVL